MKKLWRIISAFLWTRDENGRHTIQKIPVLEGVERGEVKDRVLREAFKKGKIRQGQGDNDTI